MNLLFSCSNFSSMTSHCGTRQPQKGVHTAAVWSVTHAFVSWLCSMFHSRYVHTYLEAVFIYILLSVVASGVIWSLEWSRKCTVYKILNSYCCFIFKKHITYRRLQYEVNCLFSGGGIDFVNIEEFRILLILRYFLHWNKIATTRFEISYLFERTILSS